MALGAGLFFIGYALCEVPSNLLLLRFGPKRWLARIMFTWGLLAAAMMFVRTPLEFYTVAPAAGHGRGGLLSRRDLLPHALVPGHDARPRSQPLLRCPSAQLGA